MLAVGTGVAASAAVGNALTLNTWGTLAAGAAAVGLGSLHAGLGCSSPLNLGNPPASNKDAVRPCSSGYEKIVFRVRNKNGAFMSNQYESTTVPVWSRSSKDTDTISWTQWPSGAFNAGLYLKSDGAYFTVDSVQCKSGVTPGPVPISPQTYNYNYFDSTTNTTNNYQFVGGHIDASFTFRPTWQVTFDPSLNLGPVNITVGGGGQGPYVTPPPDGSPIPGPDWPILPPPEERCNCPGGGGDADLGPVLAAIGELSADVAALEGLILVPSEAKDWKLSSPCVMDANGDRIEAVIGLPASGDRLTAIMGRLEGLALVHQAAKNLKQPICAGVKPVGQPVTVQFEEI